MTIIYTDLSPSGRIDTDQIQSTYAYNADGTLASESITYNGVLGSGTWKRSFSYVTVNSLQKPTGNPVWVKQ
jgi:hypothetical protein